MVVWSIESALRSKTLHRFVVSTEDVEIAQVSIKAGADVLKRPDELATDDATTLEVLKHAIECIPCETVVLLQPTSPIRGDLIDFCVKRFYAMKPDTLATGYMSTHREWSGEHAPRQKIEPYFHDDGCVYIFKREVIESGRWIGDNPLRLVVDPIYNLEIDTLADFWAVEGIMNHVSPLVG